MPKTKQEIIDEIKAHIDSDKSPYSTWYIGITNDANRRLFDENEHNVSKENGWWIYRSSGTKDIAQEIKKFFLELGLKGVRGGGAEDTLIVYAYKISPSTKQ
jgi:hypothetical protein